MEYVEDKGRSGVFQGREEQRRVLRTRGGAARAEDEGEGGGTR